MLPLARANRVLLTILTFIWLPVCYSSSFDAICDSVQQLGDCQARINIPTLALSYCSQKFFKVDPCKTRLSGRYPCGVSWSGIKWCDGWTCVAGTVETLISVPCGVIVGSKPVDLCDMARQTIPGMDEITRQAVGYCRCLPKVLDFVDLDTVKSLVSSLDIGGAEADLLQKYGDAQVCMIDNGFNIQDNKDDLFINNGALVQTDSEKIFTAAEIDLSRYISLATALATCITGCDISAIEGFFTDYLTDSEEDMSGQLQRFLTPWQDSFSGIQDQFDQLGSDMSEIQAKFTTITKSVQTITNDFCADVENCIDTTVSKLNAKVQKTVKSSQAFIGLQAQLKTTVANTEKLYTIVSDAIDAFDTLADLGIDSIVQKAVHGEFGGIEDLAESLQAVQKLPSIFGQLQKTLPNVQKYVKQLQDLAPEFLGNMYTIVGESWLSDLPSDEAAAQAAETAVQEIQSLFEDKVMMHVTGITGAVASTITLLQSVSVSGIPSIEVHVASYQRWSTGHFSMPCLTTGTITLSLLGFSRDLDYPKFYRCEQSYEIPFPNHHIPYVKVSFPDNAAPPRPTFLPAQTSVSPEALATDFTVSILSATQPMVTPTQVSVDPTITSFAVKQPSISQDVWPHISTPDSDAASLPPTVAPDPIDASATAITLSAGNAATMPSDVYSKTEDIPVAATTSFGSSIVFFSTVNAAGKAVVSTTTLTGTETFRVLSTEVVHSVVQTSLGNANSATPPGFVSGELTGSSAPTATAPGTPGAADRLHHTAWTATVVCILIVVLA